MVKNNEVKIIYLLHMKQFAENNMDNFFRVEIESLSIFKEENDNE